VIPRYQTVLFFILLAVSIVMGVALWHLRARAHERILAGMDTTPTQAPLVAPPEQATLYYASDADNSLSPEVLSLPLPPSPNARARAVLGKLMDLYSAPNASHPVPGGAASIAQVFLLPEPSSDSAVTAAPAAPKNANAPSTPQKELPSGPQLAVVNLTAAFANGHPSGLETETLTILSICATLHANLPRIAEVRFLVDGQPRATLAGHADLTRTYLTADAIPTEGSHP
jgi:hypothetical protein